jgi:uncharacterized protein YndB with AHSA1/START domain
MTPSRLPKPEPKLDLVLERVIDVPQELVWAAWTEPEHLSKWFSPAPWTVSDCEIDLCPGGIFRTTMRSPEGQAFPHVGCYEIDRMRSPVSDWRELPCKVSRGVQT